MTKDTLDKFIQLIPDLVYIQEFPSKKITFINRKFSVILGYDKEDLIRNDFSIAPMKKGGKAPELIFTLPVLLCSTLNGPGSSG